MCAHPLRLKGKDGLIRQVPCGNCLNCKKAKERK